MTTELHDRTELRERTEGMACAAAGDERRERLAGYQSWAHLLFVHWRVSPEAVRPLVPAGLEVETFDGDAWVGLVAFAMSGVRPWWFPPLPGVSAFLETNIRTYVRPPGGESGVWFIGMEASSRLASRVARRRWYLPYFYADMTLERTQGRIHYAGRRRAGPHRGCGYQITAETGPPIAPGKLERFLTDRYVLYARSPRGTIYRGRVAHEPYPLREASLVRCDQTLLAADGIAAADGPCHALYCPGVDVRVFQLRRITGD